MKSAKHTKYEGNPRHAKGLQIFSDREYKRLAKRAASMALAAAMAASTLCAPALAYDYTIDETHGTVYTESTNDGVLSWQDIFENGKQSISDIFNHTISGDNTINITGSNNNLNGPLLQVGSGTTGVTDEDGVKHDSLDINIGTNANKDGSTGVTATVNKGSVIKVEGDDTKVNINIKDSNLTSTDGSAAIDVDGHTNVDIEKSNIKGGGNSHAAIEAKGNSKVALDHSHVENEAGTGVSVEPNATLIIGGAEIQPGTLILSPVIPEEPETKAPNEPTIESGGVGIESQGTVIVQEGTYADIDADGAGIQAGDGKVIVQEDAIADVDASVQLQGNAEMIVEGTVGSAEISLSENAQMTVKEAGESAASDETGNTKLEKDGTVSCGTTTLTGNAQLNSKGNYEAESIEMSGDAEMVMEGNLEADEISLEENAKLTIKGEGPEAVDDLMVGTVLEGKGIAVVENVNLKGNALLKVSDEGTMAVKNLNLGSDYTNPVELGGLLYLENLYTNREDQYDYDYEAFKDAALMEHFKTSSTFDAVGTGLRFATFAASDTDGDGWPDRDSNYREKGVMQAYYQIGEGDDSKEITIDLYDIMWRTLNARSLIGEWRESQMPGDAYNYDVQFASKSGHEYAYKEGSFSVSPMQLTEETLKAMSNRCPNEAIQALYGKTDEHAVTVQDLVNAETKLKQEGYTFKDGTTKKYTSNTALEEFYLDYLNEKFGTNYSSLEEATPEQVMSVTSSYMAPFYTVTAEELKTLKNSKVVFVKKDLGNGEYEIQIKEKYGTNGLWRFYNELLSVGYNTHKDSVFVNEDDPTIGRINNPETGFYASYEELFKDLFGTEENPFADGETLLKTYFSIDLANTGNEYATMDFGWNNTITLSRIDPDPVPPTTDPEDPTPDPDPTPDEPTLILTPVPEEETPLAPAPVEEIPEEETPLVDAPVIDESLEEVIEELGEEEVPLASAPKTGDESGAFGLMAVLSGMALAVMSFFGKKKEQ